MTTKPSTEQKSVPCPRCDKNPVPDTGNDICASCKKEEADEQRAAENDLQTRREKAQGDAAAQQKPPTATGAKPPLAQQQKPPAQQQKSPPPAAPVKRMSLANVKEGADVAPYRLTLYGVEGIGKSTYGAEAPSPIFLPVEQSTNIVCPKFPQPTCFTDFVDAIDTLGVEKHEYKTLVLDTADAAEPLIWDAVIADDNARGQGKGKKARTIEDVGGGYMKGYVAAISKWRTILARLERLQAAKQMNVIILAHSQVKPFKNPEGDDYDRWSMKLHHALAALLREWSEAVLFANYDTKVAQDRRGRSLRKGIGGDRVVHTERSPAYDAKNRYGLPRTLPLGWAEFDAAVQANRTPEAMRALIEEKLQALGDPQIATWVAGELAKSPPLSMLSRIHNRLSVRLEEKERADDEQPQDGGAT